MKYIRPFDRNALAPNGAEWLLSPTEDAGCAIQLRRGGNETGVKSSPDERFALVLSGEAKLLSAGTEAPAVQGDLIFIPANSTAGIAGGGDAVWVEVNAPVTEDAKAAPGVARVAKVDHSRFEGQGFAYQGLIDRAGGAATMRMNVLQVQPGSGSPDYHIHAFAQIYVIQEGEMTIDIGRKRLKAGADTLVFLPAGTVHRNFNASSGMERHVSLLVPEPGEGEIFDFAVTIHDNEAELLTQLPA